MPTKNEFITKAIGAGLNDNEIKIALSERRAKLGAFDDDDEEVQPTVAPTQPEEETTFAERIGFGPTDPAKRTLFGLPKEAERTVFPRAAEAKTAPRKIAGGVADVLSIPGRTIASLPALKPGGETFGEAFKRTEGKSFVGDVVRDPSLIPGILATGGTSAVTKAPIRIGIKEGAKKIAGIAGRGAAESVAGAVTRQIEEFGEGEELTAEDIKQFAGEVAAGAGLSLGTKLTGAIAKKILKAPAELGRKVMNNYLRPPLKIYNDGFDAKNVVKHNLFGDHGQIIAQADDKISTLKNKLIKKVEKSPVEVDIINTLTEAIDEVDLNKGKFPQLFGVAPEAAEGVKENLINYIQDLAGNESAIDLAKAQKIKEIVGQLGSWAHGTKDSQLNATEAYANKIYINLKNQIEKALPNDAKALNKEISEILPIKYAAIRRLPIEARSDVVNLNDAVIFSQMFASEETKNQLGNLIFGTIRRATKSPLLAEAAGLTGQAIEGVTKQPASQAARRIGVAATPGLRAAARTQLPSLEEPKRRR